MITYLQSEWAAKDWKSLEGRFIDSGNIDLSEKIVKIFVNDYIDHGGTQRQSIEAKVVLCTDGKPRKGSGMRYMITLSPNMRIVNSKGEKSNLCKSIPTQKRLIAV